MDSRKEQQVVELIKNRLDLNYVQIAFLTGVPLTAVQVAAKRNNCQRKRGRRPWKKATPVTTPVVSAQGR